MGVYYCKWIGELIIYEMRDEILKKNIQKTMQSIQGLCDKE